MSKEKEAIVERLGIVAQHNLKGTNQSIVEAEGEILITESGVGPVATAYMLGLITAQFEITQVILLGVGGALDSDLGLGDLVLVTGVIQHDAMFWGNKETHLMKAGELYLTHPNKDSIEIQFASDKNLNNDLTAFLKEKGCEVKVGIILSGSSFCGTHDSKMALKKIEPRAIMVDMESISVAYAATMQKIPFTVLKGVVDRMHESTVSEDEYISSIDSVCKKAALVGQFFKQRVN